MPTLRSYAILMELELVRYRISLCLVAFSSLIVGFGQLNLPALLTDRPPLDIKKNNGELIWSIFLLIVWMVIGAGPAYWKERRHFVSTRTAFLGMSLSCGSSVAYIALALFVLIDKPSADIYYKLNWFIFGLCSLIISLTSFSFWRNSRNPVTEVNQAWLPAVPLPNEVASPAA
jgi:hypothetical protein